MLSIINSRYQIIQELGKGGMGSVYLVEDTMQDNQVVALKMIRADLLGERNLAQFRYEFAALSSLRHPNLVAVYDFGAITDSEEGVTSALQDYFFTMEYVAGEDLVELAARRAPGDYTWLYEITVQVCRALQYIHSRGFVHYDVKPRNIRITPDGQVKLMDFGLIGAARGEAQVQVRGTLEYIAPELIRGVQADHRVDLYSLGVSLYEVVTGRLPFTGDSGTLILRQHVESTPEPPRELVSDIPEALQTLILKLMAKEPVNRYPSANAVIQAINELTGLDFPVETKESKRGYIQSGNFVGHEAEMARLQGLLMRAIQGQGQLVLITGPLGSGKTRLMRELRLRAQMQHVLVCIGTCYKETRSPYRPWVSILSQVISHQQSCAPEMLQIHGAALAKLMPELARQLPIALDDAVPTDKPRLMEAMVRFLLACEPSLLLILEDLHYADTETIELLDHLGPHISRGRLLICGVYCDDELDETHPLNALVRQARMIRPPGEAEPEMAEKPYDLLHLDPLTEEAAAALIKSMLGVPELPPGLSARLMAETGGNPLFLESVMHSLVEEDLLRYDGEMWHVDVAKMHIPANIQEAARRRLERLDHESLAMLQWAAVMGPWLDMDILTEVCSLPPGRMFQLVAGAVQQYHVLTISEQDGRTVYSFSDEQMREAVYNTLSPEQLIQRHRRVGETLRKLYDESEIVELLAWHSERAGDTDLALRYSKMAADKARQMYANESAIQHYSRALKLLRANSAAEYKLLAGREDCYRLVGDWQAQQADLEAMARLAEEMGDVTKKIEVVKRQVALANARGNHAEAQRAAEVALELARRVGDRKLEADMLNSLGQACFGVGEHDRAQAYHEQSLPLYREVGDRLGEATSLRLLGEAARRASKTAPAQEYYKQALALYRDLGNRPGESDTLIALGALANDQAQARRYYEQALAIAQATGDRRVQSRSYNNLAIIYWALGLYSRARDYAEQAVQIQREIGGRSRLAYDLETLGRVYLELEEYAAAQQALAEGLALTIDIGDPWAESVYRIMLGRVALTQGQLVEARELIQVACDIQREQDTPDVLSTSLAWLGATYLALGAWEAAHRCTSEAIMHRKRAGNYGEYPPQDVWWLHYQVLKTAPQPNRFDDEAWTCLQRARETMMAGIATLSDEGLRRNYLNKVKFNRDIITEWTRQAARRGETGQEAEAVDADLSLRLLETEADLAPPMAQVEDKLERVLDISARMNETLDVAILLSYVMEQVIELSGAERGFLVLMAENGLMDFKVARGMAQDEIARAKAQISYTVIGTVAQSKMPVLLQDALTDERFGKQSSVLELNLRSVLCVPLISRSELIGMIYADNRSVSGRFSQTDVNLMTIFTNQAAIAIENARLHEETSRANKELEKWARTLEQRVAERTTELQQANETLSRRAVQLETSSQVGQQVTSILQLDELLNEVVNLIQERFGYYFVGVWLLDDQKNGVVLRAGTGQVSAHPREEEAYIPLGTSSIIARVCATGECRLVNDVRVEPDYLAIEMLPDTLSELSLPLRMGEQIIGVLDIQSTKLAAFTPDDRMVLQTLADQVAITIRNAQLYESEQNRRRFAESLEQTGRTLTSSLDMREVPALILERLADVVPYERGAVLIQEDKVMRLIAQRGFPEGKRALDLTIPIREGDVYQQVVSTHRPVIVADVNAASGWHQVEWLPIDRSWIGVPLVSKGRVIGMISLTRREPAAFSPSDATLVSTFAAQAAIALENASLYDEITQFSERLEHEVQQRTAELNKAYRTLEQLDKTKTDFIDVTAHELRTPLTLVKGYAQMLEEHATAKDIPDLAEHLKNILTNADRLHAILDGMLTVAKIDTQVLDMHPQKVVLADIIGGVCSGFIPALSSRRLTLTATALENLPPIRADADLLFEAFYHLIINAIKYTPDGGAVTVTGSAVVDAEVGPAAEIIVSDTGVGIDPAHHKLIFEKFYQTGDIALHSSGLTKFKGGGPGLGLAIVKGIVVAHGGKIWVESAGYDEETCPGSRFYVRLPVKG